MKTLKLIALFVFLFLSAFCQANDFKFQLKKHQKALRTFSGDLNQETSIHLIIFKDKKLKNYGIKPFFVDKNDNVNEFEIISFDTDPSVLSYHLNDNILSILFRTQENNIEGTTENNRRAPQKPGVSTFEFKEKPHSISIVDMNLENKEIIISKLVNRKTKIEQNYYRFPNHTLSVLMREDNLFIQKIINSTTIDSIPIKFSERDSKLAKELLSSRFQFVNTNEYVQNGSISNTKFYYEKDKLYYTKLDEKNKKLIIATVSINQEITPIIKKIELPEEYKVRWAAIATYVYNENLFIFGRNPSAMYLDVISFDSGKSIYRANLKKDLGKFLDLKTLSSLQNKLSYTNNKPTITVNTTIDNNMLVRFDFVKSDNYFYLHDHLFWMQQQMLFQHQMNFTPPQNMLPSGFGPIDPSINSTSENVLFTLKKKDVFQEVVLNSSYEIVEEGTIETIKEKIEKGKFIALMNKMRDTKFLTSAFSKKNVRYIFYLKTLDGFIIKTSSYTQ